MVRIIAKKYMVARQLFSDKEVLLQVKSLDEQTSVNLENGKSIINSFNVFKLWYQEIRQESPSFNKQINESFSSLHRISVLGYRRDTGWTKGYFSYQDKIFGFRNEFMTLFSRRYVWKYSDVINITHHDVGHITLRFINGLSFSFISSYTEYILEHINRKKDDLKVNSDDDIEVEDWVSAYNQDLTIKKEIIVPPRCAQFLRGKRDPEYLIDSVTITNDDKEENNVNYFDDNTDDDKECNNILEEVKKLTTKLQRINIIISEELDGQLEMLSVIDELVESNKNQLENLDRGLDKLK